MAEWPFDLKRQIIPTRRIEKEYQNAADEFAEPVGRAIWARNYCHSAFGRLFAQTATPQNLLIGYAMWHTLQSDAAQRELLIAAAEVTFARKPEILRRIAWAKNAGDSLATIRNDAAHLATAWTTYPNPKVVADPLSTAPKRFRRVQAYQDLEKKLALLHGDLIALCHFLSALSAVLAARSFIHCLVDRGCDPFQSRVCLRRKVVGASCQRLGPCRRHPFRNFVGLSLGRW